MLKIKGLASTNDKYIPLYEPFFTQTFFLIPFNNHKLASIFISDTVKPKVDQLYHS